MALLIGMDEAGYGPNLGPLVIAASSWRTPGPAHELAELEQLLAACFVAAETREPRSEKIRVDDSKRLYHAGGSLAPLELGFLACLGAATELPADSRSLWRAVAGSSCRQLARLPWHADWNCRLPCAADGDAVIRAARRLRAAWAEAGVELLGIRATVLFPERYNRRLERAGNKAAVLSESTFALLRHALAQQRDEPARIHCDKHGGRDRYGSLLQRYFPDHLIEVRQEGRRESRYRWGTPQRRIEARFVAQGDRFLPAALASMAAKYLRELSMQAFNDFWQREVPGVRPTAGYPGDAKRFVREIALRQGQLEIPDRLLWRTR